MLTRRLATLSPLTIRPQLASTLPRPTAAAVATSPVRPLSTTQARSSGGSDDHSSHYDPPGGWLWGIRPGEKYEKEGWENLFFYGFYGSIGLACVAYAFKPDTSIQTWALEEARRRLEIEGILEDPEKK
ncbi:hypothetical protein EPUS_05991 [Endocarpon pusillum Z07020]|uniref:NADH dehydrogenase [ubiquinone] 1 beta subcomplex subunit 11, mitochondrial n=1 Tax=Endocarpon pusillum (strain Z07020 / HMAS-L-300199) TaxID=1263415 RepID=U1G1P8_ENDPU|nr:uncharacterized protein EPUS_05991 [Endocarpon pusillum Z07020]ERF71162.1 hypothetical protein EPUS_05991 [Endocarpon pusillum Z07020]